ncbi:MAG: GAF domain-containing protein [Cyanobacteria bacterium P01_D01_bin.44]
MIDDTKLVWDLQRANQIAQKFSTSLDLAEIAHIATDGLVEHFDCAFARLWLVEPDGKLLRLVASSGLYTRLNGSFSQIPMGELKIGKIAQSRISLLSNNLAQEHWVGRPEWAIANNINSFAGYPLVSGDRVIGVLGIFGHNPMRSEFLEVLLSLCTTLTVALEIAKQHHQNSRAVTAKAALTERSLSESLAQVLVQAKLTVLGTERCLDLSQTQLFLRVAEVLKTLECTYCRLTYEAESVSLEAIAATTSKVSQEQETWKQSAFSHLTLIVSCFGGILKVNTEASIQAMQVSLTFPSSAALPALSLRVQCHQPLLQTGFTQLAYSAGLRVQTEADPQLPLLTDQASLVDSSDRTVWVAHPSVAIPGGVKARVNLSTTPEQLRDAVEAVMRGDTWGLDRDTQTQQRLSNREQEVIALLAKGLRDREIAKQLYISDSTVKFHINNILAKLGAKTRMQALYQLMSSEGLTL